MCGAGETARQLGGQAALAEGPCFRTMSGGSQLPVTLATEASDLHWNLH